MFWNCSDCTNQPAAEGRLTILFFCACWCCRYAILWTWANMVLQCTKISITCSTKLCNNVTQRHYCCSKGKTNISQECDDMTRNYFAAPCKILNFAFCFSMTRSTSLMVLTSQSAGTCTFSLGRCEIYPKSQRLSSSAAWTTTQWMHVPPLPVHTNTQTLLGHTCASVTRAALSDTISKDLIGKKQHVHKFR